MPVPLALPDDLVAALRVRSETEGRPVEAVLADAVRRGLSTPPEFRNGIRLFPVRPGTPPVTIELIRQLQDELDDAELRHQIALARPTRHGGSDE